MIVVQRGRPRDPERLQQEMEVAFRALMPGRTRIGAGEHALWRPPLEAYETDDALVVYAEVAGLLATDERHLQVVIDHDRLVIRGERPDPRPAERRTYHEARVPYGAFGADIYLPFPVDVERTVAEYDNGFLRVTLPRIAAWTIVPRPDEDAARGEGAR